MVLPAVGSSVITTDPAISSMAGEQAPNETTNGPNPPGSTLNATLPVNLVPGAGFLHISRNPVGFLFVYVTSVTPLKIRTPITPLARSGSLPEDRLGGATIMLDTTSPIGIISFTFTK